MSTSPLGNVERQIEFYKRIFMKSIKKCEDDSQNDSQDMESKEAKKTTSPINESNKRKLEMSSNNYLPDAKRGKKSIQKCDDDSQKFVDHLQDDVECEEVEQTASLVNENAPGNLQQYAEDKMQQMLKRRQEIENLMKTVCGPPRPDYQPPAPDYMYEPPDNHVDVPAHVREVYICTCQKGDGAILHNEE